MIAGGPLVLTAVTALGCAVVGGILLAFSALVMGALGRLPAAKGIAAMQSINRRAVTPVFMALLFGTALACAAVVALGAARWGEPYSARLVVGGGLYLLGVMFSTAAFHVPRNDALAGLDPDSPGAGQRWDRYRRSWTAGNHVRALAAVAASAVLLSALRAA